jgi:hypothetical protein
VKRLLLSQDNTSTGTLQEFRVAHTPLLYKSNPSSGFVISSSAKSNTAPSSLVIFHRNTSNCPAFPLRIEVKDAVPRAAISDESVVGSASGEKYSQRTLRSSHGELDVDASREHVNLCTEAPFSI